MMIKITEKCSMGCSHCMNNATPNGKHMDFKTFMSAIEFQKGYGGPFVIITGGEPTEHPDFLKFLDYIHQELCGTFITVTTNGVWMQTHEEEVFKRKDIQWQVTNVKEYYPIQIDTSLRVFSLPNVVVCDKIEHMYPQGRAEQNEFPWKSKGSKCLNVRLITHQVEYKSLRNIISMMAVKGFFCTPHISIDGSIKLGESDLCPVCSSIFKTEPEIINDILSFKCSQCSTVNSNLSQQIKDILGEI